MLLNSFVTYNAQSKPVVLIDLSNWTAYPKEAVKILANVELWRGKCTIVVAHSSGVGTFRSEEKPSRRMMRLESEQRIKLFPFTENEAKIYIKTFCSQLSSYMTGLKDLTNYNPYLLYLCSNKSCLEDATDSVTRHVRKHVDNVKTSLVSNRYEWVQHNLSVSEEMLHYAVNQMAVKNTRKKMYNNSWIHAEGITYIAEEREGDKFVLRVNFPPIVVYLKEMLKLKCKTSNTSYNSIICGFRFEDEIVKEAESKQLVLTCKKNGECAQTESVAKTFTFQCCVEMEFNPLTHMNENVLYHVRGKHPVIDVVGKLKDENGEQWLLLIQISLSAYANHKSKAVDLWKNITEPEKTHSSDHDKTWLHYYRSLTSGDVTCMYVYISPEEIADVPDILAFSVGSQTRENNMMKEKSDLFLGLVMKNSQTDVWVTSVAAKVR